MPDLASPKASSRKRKHQASTASVNGDDCLPTNGPHANGAPLPPLMKCDLTKVLKENIAKLPRSALVNGDHIVNGHYLANGFAMPLSKTSLRTLQKKGGWKGADILPFMKDSIAGALRENFKRSSTDDLDALETMSSLSGYATRRRSVRSSLKVLPPPSPSASLDKDVFSKVCFFQNLDLAAGHGASRGAPPVTTATEEPTPSGLRQLRSTACEHKTQSGGTLLRSTADKGVEVNFAEFEPNETLNTTIEGFDFSIAESNLNETYDSTIKENSIAYSIKRRRAALAKSAPSTSRKDFRSKKARYADDSQTTKYLCSCISFTNVEKAKQEQCCSAVDSFEDKSVPCGREAQILMVSDTNCIMVSKLYCEDHCSRQQRHMVCPACNLFCCKGMFRRCWSTRGTQREVHYFHQSCYPNLNTCPHCESTNIVDAKLNMQAFPLREAGEEAPPKASDQLPQFTEHWIPLNISPEDFKKITLVFKSPVAKVRFNEKQFLVALRAGDPEECLKYIKVSNPNHRFRETEDTPLHIAAFHDNLPLVYMLCELGAQKNRVNKKLLTPLMVAIKNGGGKVASFLAWQPDANIDQLDQGGKSCLHLAAQYGAPPPLWQELLTRCAHINHQDSGHWSPLMWAAEHAPASIVHRMLTHGADVTLADKEMNTALHWAAYSGNSDAVEMLIQKEADVNACNTFGDTPLHLAAKKNHITSVINLLNHKANIYLANNINRTPLMVAFKRSPCYRVMKLRDLELNKIGIASKLKMEKILTGDISKGKEKVPIMVVNGVDEEGLPTDFCYVSANCETKSQNIDRTISSLASCGCSEPGGCATSKTCKCAALSQNCWYDPETGRLLDSISLPDPPLLYECNQTCQCDLRNCPNRVVQQGIQCHLQVFRTRRKGWGVRALAHVPRGTFICEYIGDIISDKDADQREDDSYLFDLESKEGEVFCLDARSFGNVSRFINHNCEPNLVPVKVLVEHQDPTAPRIALFATRDIQAYEELGFDYGAKFWAVKRKYFSCECGAACCKYLRRF